MRVSQDVDIRWKIPLMTEVSGVASGPGADNCLRNNLARALMHGRLWANDPDCVVMRDALGGMAEHEIQSQLTVYYLGGGQLTKAVPQPGTEVVNGLVTRRYTFDATDLAAEHQANYDQVEGTIWVAVEGNYIVRYEATISGQFTDIAAEAEAKSGQFGHLLGGDLTLLDEGTITMRYDLVDVDRDVTIGLPEGVGGFGFGWF